ncbi:MAG: hypothetical protein KKH80_01420, partial [Candidatus Omnitrophica bacterium]|nr:hypothetical protein [Candidatus Omnitrophota bacterium]
RYTDGFGFAKIRFEGCNKLDLALFPAVPLADLFHHYFGRYMLRNIIYGVYKFVSIEQPWLWLSISLDIALLVLTYNYIKTNKIKKNDYHLLFFAFIVFTIFIFLFLLNKSGGIASRYLTLPSIGVAMVLVWVLGKSQVIWRSVFILAMAISLVVCQGNSWIQFKASRINAGIIQSIKDRNARLASSEAVIFDFKSLADNIAYTLVKRDFNTLNMYYGALVFHKPELESMARLLAKKDNLAIYVATSTIIKDSDYSYEFEVSEENSYRSVIKNKIKLPQKGTLIINYNDIFPEGFK